MKNNSACMAGGKLSRRAALLLPLAAALPGRARAQAPDVTDAIGRKVPLKAPAQRVVLGFNFEEFTAVAGAENWTRVVGFARRQWAVNRQAVFARYQQAVPALANVADVGAAEDKSFSVEKVLSLRPDLLVIDKWGFTTLAPMMTQLQDSGVPVMVVDYQAQIPANHRASTLALGAAMGTMDRARELAELYATRVADIQARARAAGSAPKIYFEIGMGGADVIGNTYNNAIWGALLELVGGTNIAKGKIAGGWGPMAPEFVLAAQPDFVFITGSSWANAPNAVRTGYGTELETTRRTLAPYAKRPGWDSLPAIRNGELHTIEAGLARCLMDYVAMQYIARQIFPGQATDLDPVAELRRYHERYLPVAFDGTWMARLT